MAWKPTLQDIQWAKKHLACFKEGAEWYVPASGNFYRIYHIKKEICLVKGDTDKTFERNKICFAELGYKVLDKRHEIVDTQKFDNLKAIALTVHCDQEALQKFLGPMNAACAETEKGFVFTVSGFDDDPRELWEIPEVLDLYQRLFTTGFASCLEVTTTLFDDNSVMGFGAFEAWAAIHGYLHLAKRQWVNDNIKAIFPEFLKELEKSNEILQRFLSYKIEGQNRIKKFKGQ